jgi:hypothetical protein
MSVARSTSQVSSIRKRASFSSAVRSSGVSARSCRFVRIQHLQESALDIVPRFGGCTTKSLSENLVSCRPMFAQVEGI